MAVSATRLPPMAAEPAGGRVRLGRIVANMGREILVLLDRSDEARENIHIGDTVVVGSVDCFTVGTVTGMNEPAPGLEHEDADISVAQVELSGTLTRSGVELSFLRQIKQTPPLGDSVYLASAADLRRLFRNGDKNTYPIGLVTGKDSVAATVDGERLVGGGFAIFGAGSSGKSCTMASLVRALLRHRHQVFPVLIDPYNEYSRSFGKAAECIKPEPGLFPHWLLSFDELVWVLSRNGGTLDRDELSILEEAIPVARLKMKKRQEGALDRVTSAVSNVATGISVDGPLPYRVMDVLSYIDRSSAEQTDLPVQAYKRLRTRIVAATSDPRFALIFGQVSAKDSLGDLIKRIFRFDPKAAPMSVVQLGGLASGVDRLVVSVLCRLAGAVAEWGQGHRRTLLLIEDFGRYAPADPVEDADKLSLAALRELGGRPSKLGTALGLVGRDAREISRDVLARSGTFFIHQMTRQGELDVIARLLPEPADAHMGNLASLGNGEVLGVGAGVPLAARLSIADLPNAAIPREDRTYASTDNAQSDDVELLVRRWRLSGTPDWEE